MSGTVVNGANGEPVRKASVTLALRGTSQNAVAITDSNGAFRFMGLPAGKYDIVAQLVGYTVGRIGAEKTSQVGEVVTLAAGETKRVTIRMSRTASISGVVVDADGDPAVGAQVQVLVESYPRGTREFQPSSGAVTNDRGEYEIFGLDPSWPYYVAAQHMDRRVLRVVEPHLETGQGGTLVVPSEAAAQVFYPGVLDPAKARPLKLAPGQEARGIDIRVVNVRAASLKGRITGVPELESDQNFVQVTLTPLDQSVVGKQQFGGAGPPSYEFSFNDVIPGTYRVVAQVLNTPMQARAIEKVTVREGGEEEVTLALSPGVAINGKVAYEGEASSRPEKFRVVLSPGDGIQGMGNLTAETDEQGKYSIADVLPGIWDINVEPIPKGGYIKAMTLGAQDVLTEEMIISASTSDPLDIVVSSRGARLEGSIDTDRPAGNRRAWVLVAPVGKFSNVFSFYQSAASNGQGKYEFSGLTPGDYKVYVFDEITPGSWLNPEFMKKYEALGVPVKLDEGVTATAAPRLIEVKK